MKKLSAEMTLSSEEILRIVHRTGTSLRVPPGSEFKFVGLRARTKEQLQLLMYTEEMETWIAEARQEDANSRARMQAALLRDRTNSASLTTATAGSRSSSVASTAVSVGVRDNVQVVEDEEDGEATTIRRSVLPDL